MERQSLVIFGNKLENLADKLLENLGLVKSDPLIPHIVIVPNENIQNFLTQRFAEKSGIMAGVKFFTPERVVPRRIKNVLEADLKIQQEIYLLRDSGDPNLIAILGDKKIGSRIKELSSRLVEIFQNYDRFGGSFLNKWLNQDGWEQKIWRKLFLKPTEIENTQELKRVEILHIFNCDFLPKSFLEFFESWNLVYYQFSPCKFFWGDLCSKRELAKIKKDFEYFETPNTLLANLGKLGKAQLPYFEQEKFLVSDCYENFSESTVLGAVCQDLLDLQENRGGSLDSKNDKSVQIHITSCKAREVEAFFLVLQGLFNKSDLQLKDVVVLAPNIEEYVPYIKRTFSKFDYIISDVPKNFYSKFFTSLNTLLDLVVFRFSKTSVVKLFYISGFCRKFDLSKEDVEKIVKWVELAGVTWGASKKQRQLIIQSSIDEDIGTWEHCFRRLTLGLAFSNSEEDLPLGALSIVEQTDIDLLEKLISIVKSLEQDFVVLLEKKQHSLCFWINFIENLVEKYFSGLEEELWFFKELTKLKNAFESEEVEVFDSSIVFDLIQNLFKKKTKQATSFSPQTIHFSSLKLSAFIPAKVICLLGMSEEEYPRKDSNKYFFESRGLDFCPTDADKDRYSFLEAIFAAREKLIIFYPQKSKEDGKECGLSSVVEELVSYLDKKYEGNNLLFKHPDYLFSKEYFSKDSVVKNFSREDWEFAKIFYSPKETRVRIPESEQNVQNHSTNNLNFGFLPSESKKIYDEIEPLSTKRIAKGAILEGKESQDSVKIVDFEQINPKVQVNKAKPQEILDLRILNKLAKNPLRFFCNHALGIYLDKREEEDKEFCISNLNKSILRKEAYEKPFDQVFNQAIEKGMIPCGSFSLASKKKILDEVSFYKEKLETLGIKRLFSIKLDLHCENPYQNIDGNWILPALKIESSRGTKFTLVGDLGELTERGLIYFGNSKLENILKILPKYLVLFAHPKGGDFLEKSILFAKNLSKSELKIDFPKTLSDYLAYYEDSLCKISPLRPEWGEEILQKTEKLSFADLISNNQSFGFCDEYLNWVSSSPSFDLESWNDWIPSLREKFPYLVR